MLDPHQQCVFSQMNDAVIALGPHTDLLPRQLPALAPPAVPADGLPAGCLRAPGSRDAVARAHSRRGNGPAPTAGWVSGADGSCPTMVWLLCYSRFHSGGGRQHHQRPQGLVHWPQAPHASLVSLPALGEGGPPIKACAILELQHA